MCFNQLTNGGLAYHSVSEGTISAVSGSNLLLLNLLENGGQFTLIINSAGKTNVFCKLTFRFVSVNSL